MALRLASPTVPPGPLADCPPSPSVEPARDDPTHERWLYDQGERARACGDHVAAARAFDALMHEAREHGHIDVRGSATLGLARAWLEMPADADQIARLVEALRLLDALLAESSEVSGHVPDTMPFARSLRVRVDEALVRARAEAPTAPAATSSPVPTTSSESDAAPSDSAPIHSHATPSARGRSVATPAVAAGGVLLAAGVALGGVALAVRPWYGRRYRDDPDYTIPVARDLTRPWVVGYGVASAVAVVAGVALLAVFVPRLARKRLQRTGVARTKR